MKRKLLTISGIITLSVCTLLICCNAKTTANETTETPARSSNSVPAVPTASSKKILIAYFTFPEPDGVDAVAGASRLISEGEILGNTEYIARLIQKETGGDLFQIKTVHTYPGGHQEVIEYAKKEQANGTKSKLTQTISNLSDYDTIFVGFPNWWYDMPMPLYTFFEEHDFSGKTIILFCTHGGSGFSQSIQTITDLQKNATVIKGISISRNNASKAEPNVQKWLRDLKLTN